MMVSNRVLERVTFCQGGVRVRNGEQIAELGKEELAVGAFGRTGGGPAGDERVKRFGGRHACLRKYKSENGKSKEFPGTCRPEAVR